MAKVKKKQKSVVKWKKKNWYSILAPKLFSEKPLGETAAFNVKETLGRTIKTNLSLLTRNIKHKNINASFIITRIAGSNCHTEFLSYEISPIVVKRNIRHGKDRIDDSFGIITKDKRKVIIKPLLTTNQCTKNSIQTALRKKTKEEIIKIAKSKNLTELVNDIINNKLQSGLNSTLKKIYPLKSFGIRVLKVLEPLIVTEEKTEEIKSETDEEINAKKAKPKTKESETAKKTILAHQAKDITTDDESAEEEK